MLACVRFSAPGLSLTRRKWRSLIHRTGQENDGREGSLPQPPMSNGVVELCYKVEAHGDNKKQGVGTDSCHGCLGDCAWLTKWGLLHELKSSFHSQRSRVLDSSQRCPV